MLAPTGDLAVPDDCFRDGLDRNGFREPVSPCRRFVRPPPFDDVLRSRAKPTRSPWLPSSSSAARARILSASARARCADSYMPRAVERLGGARAEHEQIVGIVGAERRDGKLQLDNRDDPAADHERNRCHRVVARRSGAAEPAIPRARSLSIFKG